MNITNGIDIVEINRFKNINQKLLENIFTENEIEYIKSKNNNIETIAGMYAAKEALLKSIGVALNLYPLKDIEINHHNGIPYITFYNKIKDDINNRHFSLSISHDGNYAIAFVICY